MCRLNPAPLEVSGRTLARNGGDSQSDMVVKCKKCRTLFVDDRDTCPACGTRN